MDTEMLSVSDVARQLKVSKMTVYRLIHTKQIPAMQIGRSFRIGREDFDSYLGRVRTDGAS